MWDDFCEMVESLLILPLYWALTACTWGKTKWEKTFKSRSPSGPIIKEEVK